jgi:hypothetical protein
VLGRPIKSNQIKSNQIKSNQIKSNQIKSNQIKSNQIKSLDFIRCVDCGEHEQKHLCLLAPFMGWGCATVGNPLDYSATASVQ